MYITTFTMSPITFKPLNVCVLLLVTSLQGIYGWGRITDRRKAYECHSKCPEYNCKCQEVDWKTAKPQCIPYAWLCDAKQDCSNAADETDCICPPDNFQCGSSRGGDVQRYADEYRCIHDVVVADGKPHCLNAKDESLEVKCSLGGVVPNYEFNPNSWEPGQSLFGDTTLFGNRRNDDDDDDDQSAHRCNGIIGCPGREDEMNCQDCPPQMPNRCSCNKPDEFTCTGPLACYFTFERCDGNRDCSDGSDEEGCRKGPQFTCDSDRLRIPFYRKCDGRLDCRDGSDEKGCSCKDDEFTCDCYKTDPKSCSGWGCIEMMERCDGSTDCDDRSDENGCVCKDDKFTCDCYKTEPVSCLEDGCISNCSRCDKYFDCEDGSDEKGCPCGNHEFTCKCNNGFCSGTKCIPINMFLDDEEDCEDGSDEPFNHFKRTTSRYCDVTIRRLNAAEQCDIYTNCDNSTCFTVPDLSCTDIKKCNNSQVICSSRSSTVNASQSCDSILQCENGELEIAFKFCDGNFDCSDRSDEMGNQPGFKCSASFGRCVLPQRNLYDGVAQCEDGSDLCSEIPCFECLDHRLIISTTQLCDGIIDCFDLSDECLCEVHLTKSICEEMFVSNDSSQLKCEKVHHQCHEITPLSIESAQCRTQNSFNQPNTTTTFYPLPALLNCQSKFGDVKAVTCDGRPECRDFTDECSCERPARFCSDGCHDFYPIGDRYCDGIVDEAWKFIKKASCPEGFDEKSCPQRFICKAGNLVSIDRMQVCDGKVDCDDLSDEVNCTKNNVRLTIFSSDFEMIESIVLRGIYWFMSLLVITGNTVVIFSTTRLLFKEKISESQKLNHVLIVNLSISDFFMGIYLLLISAKSVQYSGSYGTVDYQWRSSLECSIIGSLAVISSETSCFIMTILIAFRLYNIFNPFASRTASMLKWKLLIVLAWSVSLLLAFLPVFEANSNYFVQEIWFYNQFTYSEGWNKTDVMTFACRLASLSNQTIEVDGDAWDSTRNYLHNNFPKYSPRGEVGYYGETSVCMPRIYASHSDQSWMYSLVVITFNFSCFMFVAISYLLIYHKALKGPIQKKSDKRSIQMQRRIARLIATDFACWIPICIMVYLNIGGVEMSNVVYIVTAGLLLPINSALNPLLYSSFLENYLGNCLSKRK